MRPAVFFLPLPKSRGRGRSQVVRVGRAPFAVGSSLLRARFAGAKSEDARNTKQAVAVAIATSPWVSCLTTGVQSRFFLKKYRRFTGRRCAPNTGKAIQISKEIA